jgi:hypothetical protein
VRVIRSAYGLFTSIAVSNNPTPPPVYPRQFFWRCLVLLGAATFAIGGMLWLR